MVDPIRPIGPVERDLEPVVHVTRTPRDAQRERREREEQPPPRRPKPPADAPAPPPEDDQGPSLIDVRV
jgi:hypothetical protein